MNSAQDAKTTRTADVDVAIIGAGAAGIAAARTLDATGLRVAVVEAQHRCGGRAWTEHESFGVPFDRGCAWLHQASRNPLRALADTHGIAYAQKMPTRVAIHGEILPPARCQAVERYLHDTFEITAAEGRAGGDRPASAVRDPSHPWAPIADYLLTTINAVEPHAYSTAEAGAEEELHEDWLVEQGLGTLFERLAHDLPIELATPVEAIDYRANPIKLQTPRGTLRARCAIVTVSTGVLGSRRLRFRPDLPEWKYEALAGVPMGFAEKIALAFHDDVLPVPENTYLSIMDESGAFGFHARPFGHPLAVAYTGGNLAREVADWTTAAATDYALEWLRSALGNGIARRFRHGARTAWRHSHWIAGAYSAARPGHHHQRRRLALPVSQRLFFAGEATVSDCFATAHGAWLSGVRAAGEALAALEQDAGAGDGTPTPSKITHGFQSRDDDDE